MSLPEKTPVKFGKARMNVDDEVVFENLRANLRRPLPQVHIGPSNAKRVVLAAGGPSLKDNIELIRRKYFWKGVPI